jgi:hypothetical protein
LDLKPGRIFNNLEVLDQVQFFGVSDSGSPVAYLEFAVDISGMEAQCGQGDIHFTGDFRSRPICRQHAQHIKFPWAERFKK